MALFGADLATPAPASGSVWQAWFQWLGWLSEVCESQACQHRHQIEKRNMAQGGRGRKWQGGYEGITKATNAERDARRADDKRSCRGCSGTKFKVGIALWGAMAEVRTCLGLISTCLGFSSSCLGRTCPVSHRLELLLLSCLLPCSTALSHCSSTFTWASCPVLLPPGTDGCSQWRATVDTQIPGADSLTTLTAASSQTSMAGPPQCAKRCTG